MSRNVDVTQETPEAQPRARRRGCWLFAAVVLLFVLCTVVALVALLTLLGETNAIRMTLNPARATVATGEVFTLSITIENVDLDEVQITGIGLDESLLDGMTVSATDPVYRSFEQRDIPLYGTWTEYKLDQTLLGGSTLTVTVQLQATEPGAYSGNVSVWIEGEEMGVSITRARRETFELEVRQAG